MNWFLGFILVLVWHVIDEQLNRRERDKLLNRIMAKDYQEYEYYDKKYKGDLREVKALRDESRKDRATEEDDQAAASVGDKVEKVMAALEEDWAPGEIDETKIEDILK